MPVELTRAEELLNSQSLKRNAQGEDAARLLMEMKVGLLHVVKNPKNPKNLSSFVTRNSSNMSSRISVKVLVILLLVLLLIFCYFFGIFWRMVKEKLF